MNKTWILVSDARRARCFERSGPHSALTELECFVHAQQRHAGAPASGDVSGDAGKGHGRTGHAGTQFEPKTASRTVERREFARQLAKYINQGVAEHRCASLVLIATGPMLGELRPCLSHDAEKALKTCVVSDLTRYQGEQLRERIDDALKVQA
jgi:protein required for attachment to host cells